MEFLFKKWREVPIDRRKSIKKDTLENLNNCMGLTELVKEIENLPCYLKNTKNTVLASGDFNSPIMFIGEAPGEEENSQKTPFVGASGKLLNKMLEAIGVNRDKVYITNMFFWQPEENRIPTSQELKMTLPLVEKHILLQKPKVIVTLGAVAAKSLLKITEGILNLRGTLQPMILKENSIPVFIACHPSYILRTHKINEYLDDFKKIKDYLIKENLYSQVQL
jgi:uracil-DNA glycosylase family 4